MDLIKKFQNLYKENRQIALLSFVYGLVAAVTLIVCGLLALINQWLGQKLLIIPGICLLALILNLVIWSLARTAIESIGSSEKNNKKSK